MENDEWTPAYLPWRRQTTCFTRTCDQLISGRNLQYNRVLEIVQNEEYLSAADIGQIRKTGRVESRGRRIKRQVITSGGIKGRLCNGDGTDISGFVCGAEGDICSPDLTPFPFILFGAGPSRQATQFHTLPKTKITKTSGL